jgi:hypothetical protein
MAQRIATADEIASIDTWAAGVDNPAASEMAIHLSFSTAFPHAVAADVDTPADLTWLPFHSSEINDDETEVTFVVTYNESVLTEAVDATDEDPAIPATFTTAEVTKTFQIDISLVPDGPAQDDADEE